MTKRRLQCGSGLTTHCSRFSLSRGPSAVAGAAPPQRKSRHLRLRRPQPSAAPIMAGISSIPPASASLMAWSTTTTPQPRPSTPSSSKCTRMASAACASPSISPVASTPAPSWIQPGATYRRASAETSPISSPPSKQPALWRSKSASIRRATISPSTGAPSAATTTTRIGRSFKICAPSSPRPESLPLRSAQRRHPAAVLPGIRPAAPIRPDAVE